MQDNTLHLLFKRQIPDHIRSSYPLFVEFLKAYQEFLQQTQAQELEKFRDIDTVTDEFVNRFVSELADRIKVDDLQDKRMFLKNLREFYLSRGSEASYKFIFRTFFNKDIEIAYPSKQMLRVSDGKWKQEVSIFVKNTSPTANDLFEIKGKYITIRSGKKVLRSFVDNVIRYSSDVFEVFVERSLVRNLQVDATISYEDGLNVYSGTILLAPKSIKILQKGRNFRIGDIYNLKTFLGDGCQIKVTQIDGNGGILRAKILKFALDYTNDFISSIHKDESIQANFSFARNDNIVGLNLRENASDNILESGFISKQDYMLHDANDFGETNGYNQRFYSEGSDYVGEIVTQIYHENPTNTVAEDFAQILVEVGPCSIYNGYYLSQDGFISDEMYIQDSNYYQSFSYVIKVQEELSKYADLVKAILHPAGMKMFAEQQIFNKINVSALSVFKNRVLQFADSFSTDSRGILIGEDGSIVLAPEGKAIYFIGKAIQSYLNCDTTELVKFVNKVLEDEINEQDEIVKEVYKVVSGLFSSSDSNIKFVNKAVLSPVSLLDPNIKFVNKVLEDEINEQDEIVKEVLKIVLSLFSTTDSDTKSVDKNITTPIPLSDPDKKSVNKIVSSSFNDVTDEIVKKVLKAISSLFSLLDSDTKSVDKNITTPIPLSDPDKKSVNKVTSSSFNIPLDEIDREILKILTPSIFSVGSNLDYFDIDKNILDPLNTPDTIFNRINSNIPTSSFLMDTSLIEFTIGRVLDILSVISTLDVINKKLDKKADTSSFLANSSISKTAKLDKESLTNIGDFGISKLNPYDFGLQYFSPNALDYQSGIISIT